MSNNVVELPVNLIRVGPRVRKDLGDLGPLIDSIREHGVLQPIGVTPDYDLVFGYRRLVACHERLGFDTIPAQIIDVGNILRAEIDENEVRKDYTPSEKVAIVELLRGYTHGGDRKPDQDRTGDDDGDLLTVEEAAAKVGWGRDSYFRAKQVVDDGVPELAEAMDAGRVPVAVAAEIARLHPDDQRGLLGRGVDEGKLTRRGVEKAARRLRKQRERDALKAKAGDAPSFPAPTVKLYTSRFQDIKAVAGLGDESVKLILTDIPYVGGFIPQVDDLAALADRVLVEGGVFVTYAGQLYLDDVMDRLAPYLTFRWLGCVSWNEGGNKVHTRQVTSRWKPVLIYSKGDWQPRPYWSDFLFSEDEPEKEFHDWQQNLADVEHWLRCFSQPGDLVLDPCGGGFTTAEACLRNDRRCVSCDVDWEAVSLGRLRLSRVAAELKGLPAAPVFV
jgi:ParB-like chromosome segregation protein Spo0J